MNLIKEENSEKIPNPSAVVMNSLGIVCAVIIYCLQSTMKTDLVKYSARFSSKPTFVSFFQ